jgi:pimeloyl-ACP methyl ester carboxylesterase
MSEGLRQSDSELVLGPTTVHFQVFGAPSERTPLLLTHGYASSCEMWRANAIVLCGSRQVICWDMRGHGRTTTVPNSSSYSSEACIEDIIAILDACGARKVVCAGLSLGGYMSLAFYLAHPERVAALGLFDTGPGYRNDQARERWNAYAESRAVGFETKGLAALGFSPEALLGQHDPEGLAFAARGMLVQRDSSVIDALTAICVPTLVLVGEKDEPFRKAAMFMAEQIPQATLRVLADAGHASNIDEPQAFNYAVTEFLNTLDS